MRLLSSTPQWTKCICQSYCGALACHQEKNRPYACNAESDLYLALSTLYAPTTVTKNLCYNQAMKLVALKLLSFYQYLSKLWPAQCRYYPTCSSYAKDFFTFEPLPIAFVKSALRILRCNRLFEGGIDYPIIRYKPMPLLFQPFCGTITIKYWLVPTQKEGRFWLIKEFDATTLTRSA